MHVTLGVSTFEHLSVQVVQDSLDLADASGALCVDFVQSVVGDEVEQLGVEVVETFV